MIELIDTVKDELEAFLNIEIKKCQKVLQEYVDNQITETNAIFRKFFSDNIQVITKETEKCLDKINQVSHAKTCQKQLTLFGPVDDLFEEVFGDEREEIRPLTTKEQKKLNEFKKKEEHKKRLEAAKAGLPDICTKEAIIKFKLSHNKEIREEILRNKLIVYQTYGESKKAAFLLFKKEDVLNWVSKKWGI